MSSYFVRFSRRGRLLRALERFSLRLEDRLQAGLRHPLLSPFYQSGPLTVLLLIVVGFSGVYITLFYQYSFSLAYNAVIRMNRLGMSHLMRAVHRWGAQATLLWGLVHAWRTFFMGRFRGPRWLAWVTGLAMILLLLLAGVTGYMLLFDRRAQALTAILLHLLQRFTPWGDRFAVFLLTAEAAHRSWLYPFALLATHILAFLLLAGGVWLHVKRLRRPRWFPDLPWVLLVGVVLLLVAVALPAEIGPAMDLVHLNSTPVHIDPLYLPFLALKPRIWALLLFTLTAVGMLLPWLPLTPSHPRLEIRAGRCIGCTLCAQDCPYGAITMVERHDGSRHKWVAVAHPTRCVGCGICLGSCNEHDAIVVGDLDYTTTLRAVDDLLARRQAPVVFTCERHLAVSPEVASDGAQVVVPLPCVGALPPETIAHTLDAGATAVHVVGCPPGDCANREGNQWTAARLARERHPHLRTRPLEEAVHVGWVSPARLGAVERVGLPKAREALRGFRLPEPEQWPSRWREALPAFWLLLVSVLLPALGMMAWRAMPASRLTDTPRVQCYLQVPQPPAAATEGLWALEVDGEVVATAPAAQRPLLLGAPLTPGIPHRVRFLWRNQNPSVDVVLWTDTVRLQPDEVLSVDPGLAYPHPRSR